MNRRAVAKILEGLGMLCRKNDERSGGDRRLRCLAMDHSRSRRVPNIACACVCAIWRPLNLWLALDSAMRVTAMLCTAKAVFDAPPQRQADTV